VIYIKIDILTLFPSMFESVFNESIIKRAINSNKVEINIIDFRKYSTNKHKKVDDTIYGGGAGMCISIEPIYLALKNIKTSKSHIILLSPRGIRYKQEKARDLSNYEHLIIICGHYEGIDERVNNLVDEIISIGDFVLTGGEVAAIAMVDSIVRLIPGVINEESLKDESFNDDLYDYPVYTKPEDFMGMKVPSVLLSGNHKEIDKWRRENQRKIEK